MSEQNCSEPLFRSVAPDGKTVMLSVRDDGTWTITRDGEQIAHGTGENLSISQAIKKFRALIHPRQRISTQ